MSRKHFLKLQLFKQNHFLHNLTQNYYPCHGQDTCPRCSAVLTQLLLKTRSGEVDKENGCMDGTIWIYIFTHSKTLKNDRIKTSNIQFYKQDLMGMIGHIYSNSNTHITTCAMLINYDLLDDNVKEVRLSCFRMNIKHLTGRHDGSLWQRKSRCSFPLCSNKLNSPWSSLCSGNTKLKKISVFQCSLVNSFYIFTSQMQPFFK